MSEKRDTKPKDSIFDACQCGDEARVTEYVSKGGSVTEADVENKMTMLHCAAFGGHENICRIILNCPAKDASGKLQQCDLDAADNDGWTALHFAADRGHVAIVSLLLDEGANVNAKDSMQRTPLHMAALSSRVEVLKVLLARGAARKLRNVAGMTAQDCARVAGQAEAEALLSS